MKSLSIKLKELFGEDDSIKANVIKTFRNQISSSTTSITNYFKEENWAELNKEAHKLKSSSRLLGFLEIADVLQNIEHQVKTSPNAESMSEEYSELRSRLILVNATCDEFLHSLSS